MFSLSELDPGTRERVIERYRDVNVDDSLEWWDGVYEAWRERLEGLGYPNPDIRFSGFWNQGDGASFTADSVPPPSESDVPSWPVLRGLILLGCDVDADSPVGSGETPLDWFSGKVTRFTSRYVHENTVEVSADVDFPCYTKEEDEQFGGLISRVERELVGYGDGLTETVRDLCSEIYSDLEKEYEHLTSDEAVAEWIEANGLEFDEEGNEL